MRLWTLVAVLAITATGFGQSPVEPKEAPKIKLDSPIPDSPSVKPVPIQVPNAVPCANGRCLPSAYVPVQSAVPVYYPPASQCRPVPVYAPSPCYRQMPARRGGCCLFGFFRLGCR
jgi:hypothetical protein